MECTMAEQQNAEATESTAVESQEQQGDPAEQLGDAGKKALDSERKQRAEAEKQAKALQAQLDQLNDSKLTETQRLQKQLEDLQASYQASQLEATRNRVIASESVPASLAGFVTGSDEAELLASAQALKAAVAEAAKPGTPAPDPSQGAHGASKGGSAADQFAQYVAERLNN